MARGKKPLPDKIIELRGKSKYHRPKREDIPRPPSNIPECPDHLDEGARAEWDRMVVELAPVGLLTNLDKAIFADYCQAFSTWAQAAKMIQEKGMIHLAPNGFPIQNPYLPIANKAREHMRRALIELGMTPSARSRVRVSKPKEGKSDKERFFK